MSLRNRLIFNVKWHRRIGLFCAVFVLILAVTGLLLNHTSSLELDRIKVHSSAINALYNLPSATPASFKLEDQWVSHNGIDSLYLNQQPLGDCAAPLKGAVKSNGLLTILCENELLLLTTDGELLERVTPLLGLPANSLALAEQNEQLLINTTQGVVQADLDRLEFIPTSAEIAWPSSQPPTQELTDFLSQQGPAMDLEQLILDLHSGRLFGSAGVFVMDFVAILLIALSATGFIAWQTSHKMRSKR
ncbi:PepSY-associated TM helix [gamma proteobacterium IMCC2047]|nr:PepSY-associated TM helix [gamma proteobacterium IMCC2047]